MFKSSVVKVIEDEEQEIKHLNAIILTSVERDKINKEAKRRGFYGYRIRLLLAFYGKTAHELAVGSRIRNSMTINHYINSQSVPSLQKLNRIALYFEVDIRFFKEENLMIEMIGQEYMAIRSYTGWDNELFNHKLNGK